MKSKVPFIILVLFALLIGLYPIAYFFFPRQYGFISTKSPELVQNYLWNICFYLHIIFGGISLFIGWIQFLPKIRTQKPIIHRRIGFLYILSVLLSATSGIYIGFFANEGYISSVGFILLGIVWLLSTILALTEIKNGNISKHQKWMIYSYAACFSAVTLRIYLPILSVLINPSLAYQTVAWLCWVPNIIVAALICRNLDRKNEGLLANL